LNRGRLRVRRKGEGAELEMSLLRQGKEKFTRKAMADVGNLSETVYGSLYVQWENESSQKEDEGWKGELIVALFSEKKGKREHPSYPFWEKIRC